MPLKTRRRSVLEHAIIHSQDELDRLISEYSKEKLKHKVSFKLYSKIPNSLCTEAMIVIN